MPTFPAAGELMVKAAALLITIGNVPALVKAVGVVASVAVTLIVDEPAAVGVPVMEQLLAVRPAGRFVIEQVYGETPPLTWTLLLYGVLTVPVAEGPTRVNVAAAGLITRGRLPVVVKAVGVVPSVAVT